MRSSARWRARTSGRSSCGRRSWSTSSRSSLPPMSRVAVVTDSTAYLPPGVADKHDIGVVPLHVVLGLRSGEEGVEVSPADVAAALTERRVDVSTSRPTPGEFAAAYRASDAPCVVSVHLSGALSGTVEAAHLAAADVAGEGIEVRVIDTATIAMGLGFAVIAAAEAASSGGGVEAVVAAAEKTAAATTTLFYVDTLEHLRRGGRLGAGSALFGGGVSGQAPLPVLRGWIAT